LELALAAYGLGQRLCLDFAEAPARALLALLDGLLMLWYARCSFPVLADLMRYL